MNLDDAIARFTTHLLTAGGRSRATVDGYGRDLEQLIEFSGVNTLEKLDREAILTWINKLYEREFARRSMSRKLSAVKAFINWALEYSLIDKDPVPTELKLPTELYLPHALSESEIIKLINAPRGSEPADLRDKAMLEVLYATGMRVSELTGLRISDLHFNEGFLVVTGKGNKQRTVPMGQHAIKALKDYIENGRDLLCPSNRLHEEVFLTRRGPISRSQVFRIVKSYATLVGIKSNVSPHTFRHSCASHLLAHGMDLRLVQELLGHSALATTQIYTHLDKSQLRAVYDQAHPMA